jgi:signal peptidase
MNTQISPTDQDTTEGELEEPDESESESESGEKSGLKDNIISTFKEFFIILIILLLIISSLSFYTGNWPPAVVVESDSMMHGDDSKMEVMDTGDIVLLKKISSPKDIKTYIEGQKSNYKTYGTYGDVIGFKRNGGSGTPLIHRAVVWIEYNESGSNDNPELGYSGSFDIPSMGIYNNVRFTINNYKPGNENLTVDLQVILNNFAENRIKPHGGFITKGDNNEQVDQVSGLTDNDNNPIEPVKIKWIDGEAVGEIPGLGLLKIYLTGKHTEAGNEPPATNNNILILFIVVIIILIIIFHFIFWRIERIRRKRREIEEREKIILYQNRLVRRLSYNKSRKRQAKMRLKPKSVKRDKMFSYFYDVFDIENEDNGYVRKPKPQPQRLSFLNRSKSFFRSSTPKAKPVLENSTSSQSPKRPLAPLAIPKSNVNIQKAQKAKTSPAPIAKPIAAGNPIVSEVKTKEKKDIDSVTVAKSSDSGLDFDKSRSDFRLKYQLAEQQSTTEKKAPIAKPVSKGDMISYIEKALDLERNI